MEQAIDRFGRIDSLMNNAGIFVGKPFTDYTVDDYAAITAVNLTGFFHITQRVFEQMLTQGSGHIVNVTTSLVDQPDSTRPAALASLTKGGLTRSRVRWRSSSPHAAFESTRFPSESSRIPATTRSPMRERLAFTPWAGSARSTTSSEGILYLERSPFVTGEILHIDGGQAAGH